jgi:hypothetical protein
MTEGRAKDAGVAVHGDAVLMIVRTEMIRTGRAVAGVGAKDTADVISAILVVRVDEDHVPKEDGPVRRGASQTGDLVTEGLADPARAEESETRMARAVDPRFEWIRSGCSSVSTATKTGRFPRRNFDRPTNDLGNVAIEVARERNVRDVARAMVLGVTVTGANRVDGMLGAVMVVVESGNIAGSEVPMNDHNSNENSDS